MSGEAGPGDAFVGRASELVLLDQLMDRVPNQHQSILLIGEAGIGKTRLVSEFARLLESRGVRVAQASCYPVGDAVPFAPVLQALSRLVGSEQSRQEMLGRLTDSAEQQTSGGPQEARVRRARLLRSAIDSLVDSLAVDRAVLCFEDLQWADAGSLLLINHILDARLSNPAVICTLRDGEPASPDVRALVNRIEQRSHVIALKGLPEDAIRQLVRHMLGPGWLSPKEIQTLRSLTRGNPLFLREVVLHLRESGLLQQCSIADAIVLHRLPDRLTGIIELRFSALASATRKVLAAASVLGYECTSAALASIVGEDERSIEAELEHAVRGGLLRRTPSGFQFAHPMLGKTLYDALSTSERCALHRAIAEAAHAGRVALSSAELARHHALGFAGTGNTRAVSYCVAAAEHAERLLAFESAAQFWEHALTCRPKAQRERAEIRRSLGQALANAGKWPQAMAAFREGLADFEALSDMDAVGELALALGELHRWRQELEQSEMWLKRALTLLPAETPERTNALAMLATIHRVQRPEEASPLLAELTGQIRKQQVDPAACFWVSTAFAAVGEIERADEVARTGMAEARRAGAFHTGALLAGNLLLGELSLMHGARLDEYLAVIDEGIADSADTPSLIRSLLCRSLVYGYRGEWLRVAELCERWMAEVRLASRYQVATARAIWAEASCALGQHAAAAEALAEAIPDLEHMRPLAAMHLARVLAEGPRPEEAIDLTRRYLEELIHTPRLSTARVLLGDVAASLHVPELWEQTYDLVQAEKRPMVVVYAATSVQRVLGRLAAKLKRWDEAFARFDEAARQLSEAGAAGELARTLSDHADARRARGRRGDNRKAAALASQASTVLTRLGLPPRVLSSAEAGATNGHAFGLTGREHEVLLLAAEGRRNREIAETLRVSGRTVGRHMENILAKLGVETRTEAVLKGVDVGLVSPTESRRASRRGT